MEHRAGLPYRADVASIVAMQVLAHQGGWDEILMVLAALVVFAGLLALARRRVADLEPDATPDDAVDVGPDDRERTGPA